MGLGTLAFVIFYYFCKVFVGNIFKISSSCKTDASRARKYMPKNVYMGGKTGSWSNYNHDTCWIFNGSGLYAISVLTEYGGGGTKVIANLFRGLYDKYC